MKLLTQKSLFFTVVALLMAAAPVFGSGIQGKASLRGELMAGIRVRAFGSMQEMEAGRALAVSGPTDAKGQYHLDLPPGRYFLTASDFEGNPVPGKYFAYDSDGPLYVQEGPATQANFNLIRVPEEVATEQSESSLIRGEIYFQDQLLPQAFLYLFEDPSEGFKGPGNFSMPVRGGLFELHAPPGRYYLIVRNRAWGGDLGPLGLGDQFGFYHGNPVQLESGETRHIRIETIDRRAASRDAISQAFGGARGVLVDAADNPVSGLYVFAYREANLRGVPPFVSSPSGPDGSFEVELPAPGTYFLLARGTFGGPIEDGALMGILGGSTPKPLELTAEKRIGQVRILVAPAGAPEAQ